MTVTSDSGTGAGAGEGAPDAPVGRFAGRTVVVTGVGRAGQVGELLAHAFAREGAALALLDREAAVEARAAELREAVPGRRVSAHVADLTDAADVARAAEAVRAAHGDAVHALVNAAGGFGMVGAIAETDVADWQRLHAINLTTAFVATRGFLPLLRAGRGACCFFGSVAALPGAARAGMGAYAVAKAGVVALMHTVAEEERGHGVRANAVAPSAIRTSDNEAAMGADAGYVERDELAALVLWLCSEAAAAVTGQVVRIG